MLILKGVEVVCFDTLLQVLILKVDRRKWPLADRDKRVASEMSSMATGGREPGEKITQRRRERGVGAEKRVRVADSESEACVGTPHTPAFCKKRLDLLDSKGVDFFESDKEAAND